MRIRSLCRRLQVGREARLGIMSMRLRGRLLALFRLVSVVFARSCGWVVDGVFFSFLLQLLLMDGDWWPLGVLRVCGSGSGMIRGVSQFTVLLDLIDD